MATMDSSTRKLPFKFALLLPSTGIGIGPIGKVGPTDHPMLAAISRICGSLLPAFWLSATVEATFLLYIISYLFMQDGMKPHQRHRAADFWPSQFLLTSF